MDMTRYVRTSRGGLAALTLAAADTMWLQASDDKETAMNEVASQPKHTNRLIHATSPYLRQHAHNPVDWYEWGPEALEKARREDKPIFLSIGYSACHWCHVMMHECFENEEIAAIMNRYFVNIKVDREERPDLDEIYMRATVIVTNGHGGWPMSVWLTPEGKPFFAGTYFPPESRWGRPGFRELCERIGKLWQTDRAALLKDADRLSRYVRQGLEGDLTGQASFSLDDLDRAAQRLARRFDEQRGGILSGSTNKFPPSMTLDLLLRYVQRHGRDDEQSQRLLHLVEVTLDNMARGGIYDHVAGGICRYSTDPDWHIPHFEKMLYDQALVSRAYTDAWLVTRKPLYQRIATEIFDYVLDDLRSPDGAFYSSRDADSEGEEGKFYVWMRGEILDVLGEQDGALFCDYFDVREEGNWKDRHEPGAAKNVLRIVTDIETLARKHGITPDEAHRRLEAARQKLRQVRAQRVPPARDDKVLVEWNGLMISSLARGGTAFNEPKYVEAARRAAEFVLKHQMQDGRLRRSYRDGQTTEVAFLTDYANFIEALLDLYEATFEKRWLDAAARLNRTVLDHYWDEKRGGFYLTPDDHEQLLARSRDIRDGATPSGNSVQLMNLLRLSVMLGDEDLRKRAEQTMDTFANEVLRSVGASERFLAAAEFALVGPVEVALVGDPHSEATRALLRTVYETYLPNRVLMLARPDRPDANPLSPLLAQRTLVNGRPAAYVCRNYVCKLPVTDPAALHRQLQQQ